VAGLVYKPMKGLSLYANYIEALQQGRSPAGATVVPLNNQGAGVRALHLAPEGSRRQGTTPASWA
jgi:outer membrane receptor for monomeric catechols